MERLTDDLNIIQNLADRPTENSTDLKGKFDEAANIIKNYLNNTVATEVEGVVDTVKGKLDAAQFTELKNELVKTLEDKIKNVDNALESVQKAATNYNDFVVTTTDAKTLNHGNGGTLTDAQTIVKNGYYPLGIVGYELSGTMTPNYPNTLPTLLSAYLSNRVSGSCRTNVKIIYADNDQWTYQSTYKLHILWVKVK